MEKNTDDVLTRAESEIKRLMAELENLGKISMQHDKARESLADASEGISKAATHFTSAIESLQSLAERLSSLDASSIEEKLKSLDIKAGTLSEDLNAALVQISEKFNEEAKFISSLDEKLEKYNTENSGQSAEMMENINAGFEVLKEKVSVLAKQEKDQHTSLVAIQSSSEKRIQILEQRLKTQFILILLSLGTGIAGLVVRYLLGS